MKKLLIVVSIIYAAVTIWSFIVLPDEIASHFGAGGEADGWSGKTMPLLITVTGTVVTVLAMMLTPLMIVKIPTKYINLPNRDYWLAPEHIGAARRMTEALMAEFCVMFLAFMSMVGFLTTSANLSDPIELEEEPILAGVIVLVSYTIWWFIKFCRVFRLPQDAGGARQ